MKISNNTTYVSPFLSIKREFVTFKDLVQGEHGFDLDIKFTCHFSKAVYCMALCQKVKIEIIRNFVIILWIFLKTLLRNNKNLFYDKLKKICEKHVENLFFILREKYF